MLKYRSDIDGLRAIAVVSVIIFHVFPNSITGGYLGVDIFFVISGFLITGIIYEQAKNGNFSYSVFYERRIRRLLPAFFATLLLCLGLALVFYGPEEMSDFGGSLLHSIFGLSNLFFHFNTDYFGVQAQSRPLLHTWSLSVEEQFYLFWPVILFLLIKLKLGMRLILLIAIIALSTTIGEYQARTNQSAAFYLLPSRVSELGIGGLAAIIYREYSFFQQPAKSSMLLQTVHISCLLVLIATFFWYDKDTLFPGLMALPPSIATALLLLFPIAGKLTILLNNRVARWLGLISYSAYLLHWPLLVFYKEYSLGQVGLLEGSLIIAVTLLLATIFYKYVESPFRNKHGESKRVSSASFAFMSVFFVGSFVLFSSHAWNKMSWTTYFAKDFNEEFSIIKKNRENSLTIRGQTNRKKGCHQFGKGTIEDFDHCVEIKSKAVNVLVLGDSFAADDWFMLKNAYPNANVQRITSQGCKIGPEPRSDHCRKVMKYVWNAFDKINKFDLLIVSSNWSKSYNPKNLLPLLENLNTPLVILGPRGTLTTHMMDIIEKNNSVDQVYVDPRYYRDYEALDRRFLDFAKTPNVYYVQMIPIIRKDGKIPFFAKPNHLLFYDNGHYTPEGAKYIAKRFSQKYPSVKEITK